MHSGRPKLGRLTLCRCGSGQAGLELCGDRLCRVGSDQVKWDVVGSGQVKWNVVGSGQVKWIVVGSGQVKWNVVG